RTVAAPMPLAPPVTTIRRPSSSTGPRSVEERAARRAGACARRRARGIATGEGPPVAPVPTAARGAADADALRAAPERSVDGALRHADLERVVEVRRTLPPEHGLQDLSRLPRELLDRAVVELLVAVAVARRRALLPEERP